MKENALELLRRMSAPHITAGEGVANEAAGRLGEAGVEVLVKVLEGSAADALLKLAGVRECDLIVMGSRGYGARAGLIVSSVSRRVLARTRASVLVVRSGESNLHKGPTAGM